MDIVEAKKFSLFSNILYVYKGVARNKPYLLVVMLLSVIGTIGTRYVWLFLGKRVIGCIESGLDSYSLLWQIIVISFTGMLLMLIQTFAIYWVDPAAFYVRPMFILGRNKDYFNISYQNTEDKAVMDWRQKSINATNWPHNGIEGMIRKAIVLFSELTTCIVAMIILATYSYSMIFVVIIFGTLTYCSVDKATKYEKQLTKDDVIYEQRKSDYFIKLSRDQAYGKDIRIFDLAEVILKTISTLNETIHRKYCESRNKWLKSELFVGIIDFSRESIMYTVLVLLVLENKIGIAEFTLYVGCVKNFANSFNCLVTTYASMKSCSREINDFRSFEIFCKSDGDKGKEIVGVDEISFEFKNVSFKYPYSDTYVLRDINVCISPRSKIAVVGLNGAGKTTFIKLLLRLYEPTEGKILLNGVDISTYDRKKYYELFSPVFQDLECFAFNLAENISLDSIDDTDVGLAEECARKAGLGEKIDEFEKGIYTDILKIHHEDGVVLSGGETQKMGLARALYKNAPIVILDEPTAALDALAESKMYTDFCELVHGKMAIFISHRLASTRFCDRILMFDHGEIIEDGTHDELMRNKMKYYEMFEMQSYFYKNDVETNDEKSIINM